MHEQLYLDYSTVIDGSIQYISACPPHEKRTWHKFWNNLRRRNVNKNELVQIQQEDKIPDEIHKVPEEKKVVAEIEALCNTTYCNIKMQDPCEICCCSICRAEEDSPCDGVLPDQRQSICECHPEEKFKKEYKCCDACEHHGLRRV